MSALHVHTSARQPGLTLYPDRLNLRRGNWRNPLGQPRSELQDVSYRLEQGVLWRYSQGVDVPLLDVQRALARELTVLLDVQQGAAGAPQAVAA